MGSPGLGEAPLQERPATRQGGKSSSSLHGQDRGDHSPAPPSPSPTHVKEGAEGQVTSSASRHRLSTWDGPVTGGSGSKARLPPSQCLHSDPDPGPRNERFRISYK